MQFLVPLSNQHLKSDQNLQPKTLNLLDFSLIPLGQFYSLKSPSGFPGTGITKTLVVNNGAQSHLGLEILCLFRDGKLGFWGFGDPEWTQIDQESSNSRYDDIILNKEQIYVVDITGIVCWVNFESLNLIMYCPQLYLGGQKKNLVESEGHLYVVDRYLGEGGRVTEMRVYKLDEDWGTWLHVPYSGNRLFVLGIDCCFSASTVGLSCSTDRNSIFFTDSRDEVRATKGVSGYQTRVFRLENRRIQLVAWPPPGWLSSQGSGRKCIGPADSK